jgi:hypothetical protein
MEENNCKYIECIPGKRFIANEQDAIDLIAICGEYDTNRLMLHSGNLPEDFFNLKTGFAGIILQKFVNYHIKAAAILPSEQINQGRFKEMVIEAWLFLFYWNGSGKNEKKLGGAGRRRFESPRSSA